MAVALKDGFDFLSVDRIPCNGNSMCRGLQVGNNNLSGNVETLDQRLSEGQLWLNSFQPGMAPNVVTEVRQGKVLTLITLLDVHSQVNQSDSCIDNLNIK